MCWGRRPQREGALPPLLQLAQIGGVQQLVGLQHNLVAHLKGRVHQAPVQLRLALLLRRVQQRLLQGQHPSRLLR